MLGLKERNDLGLQVVFVHHFLNDLRERLSPRFFDDAGRVTSYDRPKLMANTKSHFYCFHVPQGNAFFKSIASFNPDLSKEK